MRCGKATNEVKDEVRIQLKPVSPNPMSSLSKETVRRNELIIQIKPSQKIALRVTAKHPSFEMDIENAELDFSYGM